MSKKRILRILVSVVLVILAVPAIVIGVICSSVGPLEQMDYEQFGVTEEVVASHHQRWKQKEFQGSYFDDFRKGVVSVCVYSFANDYPYTAEDFAAIGCEKLTIREYEWKDPEKPCRYLYLTLESNTKLAVLKAIAELSKRDDVYWVSYSGYVRLL